MHNPTKMTRPEFETLFFSEKLQMLELECPKVAQFLTWNNPIKNITIYAISSFYAELVFDLGKRKIESITSFESIEYLEKHRGFMSEIEGKIRGLNENHPFQ